MWFLNRYDTNQAVQAQMARSWKFWIKEEEELYYPCSENKGTDQLRSYCEADLRLCFFAFPNVGFLMMPQQKHMIIESQLTLKN